MREIKTKVSKGFFIPQEGLHVKEGKEVVVAITDGAVTGRGESRAGWARMHDPAQVKRMICRTQITGSGQAPELKRHAVSDGHGVGHRPPAQAGMPVPHALTMIQSFSDKDTKELFESETNRRFATLSRVALRKLIQMNQARELRDLAIPPGNRL